MAEGDASLRQNHRIATLIHFGMNTRVATELALSLEERPTRDQVMLWLQQAENRMYRRFIPLWLPHLGALVAILWKVFGS